MNLLMEDQDAIDSQEEQTVAQMAHNLAEVSFRDHPLGTDENVKVLADKIAKAVWDGIAEIEEQDDK